MSNDLNKTTENHIISHAKINWLS